MSSVDLQEIENFSKDAPDWWDENGPFKPLHRLNPVRLGYIKTQICAHYGLDPRALRPFGQLRILDIGCGGGLVSEPLARLGGDVTGIDADPVAIDVAKNHAAHNKLKIDYQNRAAETLEEKFDVVLALEIIEHVASPAAFVKTVQGLVKPGGLVIFSTLNRTPKSFMLGIVAAEHILRWVPAGTHNWKKFIKPAELAGFCRQAGLSTKNMSGLVLNPLTGQFELSPGDVAVNYFLSATAS